MQTNAISTDRNDEPVVSSSPRQSQRRFGVSGGEIVLLLGVFVWNCELLFVLLFVFVLFCYYLVSISCHLLLVQQTKEQRNKGTNKSTSSVQEPRSQIQKECCSTSHSLPCSQTRINGTSRFSSLPKYNIRTCEIVTLPLTSGNYTRHTASSSRLYILNRVYEFLVHLRLGDCR